MTQAYPLQWPVERPRTPAHKREDSRFDVSQHKAQRELIRECNMMGAKNLVLSTNIQLRRDGHPYPRKEWVGGDDPEMMCRLIEQSREDAKADGRFKSGAEFEYRWSPGQSPCRTRVSIHMPRWASRLTLTVTDVRVERLQDISEADAIAEGVGRLTTSVPKMGKSIPARDAFQHLWNDINGPDAWDDNPWVAAYSFDLRKGNIDNG